MKTAVVVTTYNNPRFLSLCLLTLSRQSHSDFSLFIADDGSTQETKFKINLYRPLFKNGIEHVWHDDHGYDKSGINNATFRKLKEFEIVVCIDHDVILHPQFIEDHVSIHRVCSNALFMGRRVDLGPKITETINENNVSGFVKGLSLPLIQSGLNGDSRNIGRSIRIASPFLRKLLNRHDVSDLLGSNYSINRELLYRINGYNEDYKAYWGEDGDLFIRARNSGANLIGAKNFAVQYHLYHDRLEPKPEHQSRYLELLNDRSYVTCPNGIFKKNALPPQ